MNDLPSLIRAVTKEAYELADKRGRLPEKIEVKASFDMDLSGRLRLNHSRSFPGPIDLELHLAPLDSASGASTHSRPRGGRSRQRTEEEDPEADKPCDPVPEAGWLLRRM